MFIQLKLRLSDSITRMCSTSAKCNNTFFYRSFAGRCEWVMVQLVIQHYVVFVTLLGAFLWKISVQSHTYTSLHVLIVILWVSLDDRWHFFFCLGDAQNIVFLKLQLKQLYVLRSDRRRSEIWYTCNVKTCLYQLMRWPKWNTPTARLYIKTQHAALTADAALIPLSVSSHCLEYLLYRLSAVWLWTVLVVNGSWQAR